jgi:hypothetical protein
MSDEHFDDDFHGPDKEDPRIKANLELFKEKMSDIEDIARRNGLYARDAGLAIAPDFESGSTRPVIVANFSVGDAAWSDRVQNPKQDTTESEFRQLAAQAERERFEEMKAEMERKLREGKGIFDGENGEDSGTDAEGS